MREHVIPLDQIETLLPSIESQSPFAQADLELIELNQRGMQELEEAHEALQKEATEANEALIREFEALLAKQDAVRDSPFDFARFGPKFEPIYLRLGLAPYTNTYSYRQSELIFERQRAEDRPLSFTLDRLEMDNLNWTSDNLRISGPQSVDVEGLKFWADIALWQEQSSHFFKDLPFLIETFESKQFGSFKKYRNKLLKLYTEYQRLKWSNYLAENRIKQDRGLTIIHNGFSGKPTIFYTKYKKPSLVEQLKVLSMSKSLHYGTVEFTGYKFAYHHHDLRGRVDGMNVFEHSTWVQERVNFKTLFGVRMNHDWSEANNPFVPEDHPWNENPRFNSRNQWH